LVAGARLRFVVSLRRLEKRAAKRRVPRAPPGNYLFFAGAEWASQPKIERQAQAASAVSAGASTATVATYKQLVAVHPQRTARVSFTLGRCGQVISPVFQKRSFSCRHAETGISKSVLACRSPIRQCEPR